MLEAGYKTVPEITNFATCRVGKQSNLDMDQDQFRQSKAHNTVILSARYCFALPCSFFYIMLRSELVVGYIDDITIGGHLFTVDEDVTIIKRNGPSLGLQLYITKCELISSIIAVQSQSLNDFIAVSPPPRCTSFSRCFTGCCSKQEVRRI